MLTQQGRRCGWCAVTQWVSNEVTNRVMDWVMQRGRRCHWHVLAHDPFAWGGNGNVMWGVLIPLGIGLHEPNDDTCVVNSWVMSQQSWIRSHESLRMSHDSCLWVEWLHSWVTSHEEGVTSLYKWVTNESRLRSTNDSIPDLSPMILQHSSYRSWVMSKELWVRSLPQILITRKRDKSYSIASL